MPQSGVGVGEGFCYQVGLKHTTYYMLPLGA